MERKGPRLVLLLALVTGACVGFPDPTELSFSDPDRKAKKSGEKPGPLSSLAAVAGIRAAGGSDGGGFGLTLGGEFSRVPESGVGYEAGLLYSEYADLFEDDEVTAVELYGGGRVAYVARVLVPYAGAGVSAMGASGGDGGGSLGAYAHAGLSVRAGSHSMFGLDVRGFVGTGSGLERYLQFALTFGLSF